MQCVYKNSIGLFKYSFEYVYSNELLISKMFPTDKLKNI